MMGNIYRMIANGLIILVVCTAIALAVLAIRFNIEASDSKKQGNELADTIYTLLFEHDFEGMVPYFCDSEGNAVTADDIEAFIESMDDWSVMSTLSVGAEHTDTSVMYDNNYLAIEVYYIPDDNVYKLYFYGKKVDKTWLLEVGKYK